MAKKKAAKAAAKRKKPLTRAQKSALIVERLTTAFEQLNEDGVYDIKETADIAALARTVAGFLTLLIRR